jgi:hypothetical protein
MLHTDMCHVHREAPTGMLQHAGRHSDDAGAPQQKPHPRSQLQRRRKRKVTHSTWCTEEEVGVTGGWLFNCLTASLHPRHPAIAAGCELEHGHGVALLSPPHAMPLMSQPWLGTDPTRLRPAAWRRQHACAHTTPRELAAWAMGTGTRPPSPNMIALLRPQQSPPA